MITTGRRTYGSILPVFWLLLLTVCSAASDCFAEDRCIHPLTPPDLSSPRATLKTFLVSMNRAMDAYKKGLLDDAKMLISPALECLNLEKEAPALRQATGLDAALYLKEVLDRIEMPAYPDIPDEKAVQTQHMTRWTIPFTEISLAAVDKEESKGQFLFTAKTVKNAGKYYQKIKSLPYRPESGQGALLEKIVGSGGWIIPHVLLTHLPAWSKTNLMGQALWQWIGLLIYIAAGLIMVLLVDKIGGKALEWLDHNLRWNLTGVLSGFILPGCLIAYAQLGLWFTIKGLHIISSDVYLPIGYVFISLTYLGALWLIGVFLNILADLVISLGGFAAREMDVQLIRLGFDILTVIIVVAAVIDLGDRLGLPTYSLVAGLGIGGLAVALAGREALSNLIGTVMIILDRPFKIGDYITLSDGERGAVVGVGFRSTRIRTRDDILISIPNSIIANSKMINESAPDPVSRLRAKVGVAYGSDLDKVQDILLNVAKQNSQVVDDPAPEIRFRQFADSSLEFELLCWITLPEQKGPTIHQLNWAIKEAFQEAGIEIPFPQRDVHIKADK